MIHYSNLVSSLPPSHPASITTTTTSSFHPYPGNYTSTTPTVNDPRLLVVLISHGGLRPSASRSELVGERCVSSRTRARMRCNASPPLPAPPPANGSGSMLRMSMTTTSTSNGDSGCRFGGSSAVLSRLRWSVDVGALWSSAMLGLK